ncbi:hypothetical protein PROFUN_11210 [Planoprotostelium fungivorum]|uniref:Uncharacterized protein n=1 Tax=Planoprotostelium fungivorum TaxID=1890364 RepID=A0A2P6NAX0_9EUKA|nr:hypothetical protein PROFUN_11210 [Planoprotostelium fungivorum]
MGQFLGPARQNFQLGRPLTDQSISHNTVTFPFIALRGFDDLGRATSVQNKHMVGVRHRAASIECRSEAAPTVHPTERRPLLSERRSQDNEGDNNMHNKNLDGRQITRATPFHFKADTSPEQRIALLFPFRDGTSSAPSSPARSYRSCTAEDDETMNFSHSSRIEEELR